MDMEIESECVLLMKENQFLCQRASHLPVSREAHLEFRHGHNLLSHTVVQVK